MPQGTSGDTFGVTRKEVTVVTTEIPTKNGRAAQERVSELVGPRRDDALRAQAIERIHRLRRFKLHVVAFALGMPVLGGVWVLVEYYEEHTWPSRFASNSRLMSR